MQGSPQSFKRRAEACLHRAERVAGAFGNFRVRETLEICKLDGRPLLDGKIFERAFDAAEKLLLSGQLPRD